VEEGRTMPEYLITLLAAFIGAIFGSVGAVVARHLLAQRSEDARARAMLTQRYLYQIQDSTEALWYRLENLAFQQGRYVMPDQYFETTTLYALGRVLAIERILALEGVYPHLDTVYSELGDFLRKSRIDLSLQGLGFFQYNRISLAEAVMEREQDRFRTSTFLEFRKRYEAEDSPERRWLAPAREGIKSLSQEKMQTLLDSLAEIALRVSKETGVSTSLTEGG
jgi:hypothetical protein